MPGVMSTASAGPVYHVAMVRIELSSAQGDYAAVVGPGLLEAVEAIVAEMG